MGEQISNPPSFNVLVGQYPYGTDPSSSNPFDHPALLRKAVEYGTIFVDNAKKTFNGRMVLGVLAIPAASGTFTVADNDFTTGRVELIIGKYKLLNYIDYTPGAGAAATATAIAATISNLPGYSASALGADVTVYYEAGPANQVDFKAIHYGSKTNFTPFSPSNGYLAVGSPFAGAPLIT